MNALEKMVMAEQMAAMMDARFTGRPTKEEAADILKFALSQYDNYLDARPKPLPENVVEFGR